MPLDSRQARFSANQRRDPAELRRVQPPGAFARRSSVEAARRRPPAQTPYTKCKIGVTSPGVAVSLACRARCNGTLAEFEASPERFRMPAAKQGIRSASGGSVRKAFVHNDIQEVRFTQEDLARRVGEIGAAITRDYTSAVGDGIVLVSVLRGAAIFMADLARAIELPIEMDYMAISSYGNGAKSSGVVRILKDLTSEIEGRHVIVAEDILDSGLTLKYLLKNLSSRNPRGDASAQEDGGASRHRLQVRRVRMPRRVHRGVRSRLCRAVSQPALHRHLETGAVFVASPSRSDGARRAR